MIDMAKGWGFPLASKKAHYFLQGEPISVCGRWMFTGLREESDFKSSDDCAACRKKADRLEPATTTTTPQADTDAGR